jgi:hypothetical protein
MDKSCHATKFEKWALCMVWGAIISNGKGSQVNWDKDNRKNITANDYIQHILSVLRDLWEEQVMVIDNAGAITVMQDNALSI